MKEHHISPQSAIETDITTDQNLIREFNLFETPEGLPKSIVVKKYKPFNDILNDLKNDNNQLNYNNAQNIIDIFNTTRADSTLPTGKSISAKPHLLIVGGFVRDLMLNKQPKDIDFATDLELPEVKALLSKHFSKEIAKDDIFLDTTGQAFGVMRIRFRKTGEEYEIASFRKDIGIDDGRHPKNVEMVRRPGIDAERRDFTINALFYNPNSGLIIDYTGGLKDIKEKTLRFVGDPKERIKEDQLRVLRYIRFLFKTGFKEDLKAKQAIQNSVNQLSKLPSERIIDEINKTIAVVDSQYGEIIRIYKEFGLLKQLFPEVAQLEDCEQGPPYHMEGNVLTHTIMVANSLPKNTSLELFLAAMYHDISKPETRLESQDNNGMIKVSFHDHEEKGVEKIIPLLKKLKLSKESQKKIIWLVENHLRIFSFAKMRRSKAVTLMENPYFQDLLSLAEADQASSIPEKPETKMDFSEIINRYNIIKNEQKKLGHSYEKIKKIINGHNIIEIYKQIHGRTPEGIIIGNIKTEIENLILDKNITDTKEIQEILKNLIKNY